MRSNDAQETGSQGPEIVGVKRGDWENTPSSTASRPSEPESPEAIRREIAGTRGEMSETVDAIQEKLDRDTLVEQAKQAMGEVTERAVQEAKERAQEAIREVTEMAKETVREATVGKAEDMIGSATSSAKDTSESIMETIRANPIPAAIAAISLGWLFTKRPHRTYYDASYFNNRYGYEDKRSTAGTVGSAAQKVTDTVGESASQASDAIGDVANKAGERLSSAGDTLGQAAYSAGDTLGHAANRAGRTSKDLGSTVMDTIVANPVPAAITGIGLGWLWMNRPSSEQATYSSRGYGGASYQSSGQSSSGGIGSMAGQAQDKVQQFASQAQGTAEDLAGDASHQARRMQTGVEGMIQENPLMVGVVAAAVGAAVGMAIPSTSQESRLLGDTRQSFMEAAKETVQDVGDKVQKVAEETQNAAQKAASEQKLTT